MIERFQSGRRATQKSAPPFQLILLLLCLPLLLPACATPAKAKSKPDWVDKGGVSAEFPTGKYLTGFGTGEGQEEALESAKQQAAADLARQISVQIESDVVDVTQETNGKLSNDLTSQIRATSDIRLEGVRFETYRKRKKVWVLAVLERLPAAVKRRKQRDQALIETKQCLDGAARAEDEGRASQALAAYRSCRTPLNAALEHEAVASALQRTGLLEDGVTTELARQAQRINERVRAIPHEDAESIRSAAEGLAVQLSSAGVGRGRQMQVAPFQYQSRDISSPFGREISIAVEAAIGRTNTPSNGDMSAVVIRGTYHEDGDKFQLRANAKEAKSGRLLASAEIALSKSAIPSNIATVPPNFDSFARDADKLAGGEVVSGDLRVDVQTNKGVRGLVFDEGEEMSIFVRVNQPAYIRLIYVLTNGDHVPIDQAWYIDNEKVNQLVEYPSSFEVVPPFGVEMIHAMAYTERPPMLATRPTRIEGQDYEVVSQGADQVVRARGIARKAKKQVAEQTVQLTTMRTSIP